ncbi:MAG: hypothetical protein NC038_02860 [Paludibacter sp.]|nr:hypothetical protein [Bacteroidales bacterium]MCM1069018.1 hypothetical protein [Prevotella sp.]MCM1353681.1 hypothetical protein [Bacteroides sp.]MCM1441970.1 hypothetical protein [Muribaculum sp.]MCM1481574.1 hypothetical protein [Paludibacter sp.]
MKKYTFLVFHQEYEQFLLRLREAGVVHITEKAEGLADNPMLNEQIAFCQRLRKAQTAVAAYVPQGTALLEAPCDALENAEQRLTEFDAMVAEKAQLEQTLSAVSREAQRMQVWGTFSSEKLEQLQQNGWNVQFFTCAASKYDAAWETLYNAFVVAEQSGNVYFATVNPTNEAFALEAEEVKLNEHDYTHLLTDAEGIQHLLVAKQAKLEAWAIANLQSLQKAAEQQQQRIDWTRVQLSTDSVADHSLKLLEGFCPEELSVELNRRLDADKIYYIEETPDETDATPVKLKNNFFARLFEPITRLYSLPNYMEIDPTAFFAPFFMLFFGLCLGDGGYGLLVLLAGVFLLWKKPSMKDWGWLAVFMGISTMVVGILTGMFFGIELEKVAFLKPVRQYFITDNNFKEACHGYSPMMVFAICIGIFQILFAMGFKVVKITLQKGFKYALYDLAWLIFLVDCIVMLVPMLTGNPFVAGVQYTLYAIAGLCALLILFYSNPDRKFLVLNIGSGLWGTYNMASGLLGDVLSYIRLFALGLAGGILGNVFNQLALQVGGGLPAWIGWLPMVLIMVFGHGLNFALALISSVVHPLRLTFVEFYKNAGFEGGGQEYRPFKK